MSTGEATCGTLGLFRGACVWAGLAMALGGFIAEELTGGGHAFEILMFFGGLSLGMGIMQNRYKPAAGQPGDPQAENASHDR